VTVTTGLIVEDFDVIEDIGFHHIACLLDPFFDDGNYFLFHTECSVISNNFMLTQMDERKIEIDRNAPLGSALLLDVEPPEGFELIRTVWLEQNGQRVIYAKAFAVH